MPNNTITMGFKETKEVIDLAIALGNGIAKSLEDEKISFEDLPNFFGVIFKVIPAMEGVDQIPIEFKLANQAEADELKKYLKDQLDLPEEQMEMFIEDAFAIVLDMWQLVKTYFVKENTPDLVPTPPNDGDISEEQAPTVG